MHLALLTCVRAGIDGGRDLVKGTVSVVAKLPHRTGALQPKMIIHDFPYLRSNRFRQVVVDLTEGNAVLRGTWRP